MQSSRVKQVNHLSLTKPYTIDELAEKIRKVLDRK
ncbi:hypothetical protein X742_17300 [Mesorhizobium sp. LNHC232B00]|nr:hypothetical protein X742_17300 [Mesorhizobium sp. LNHC232B00]